MQLKKITPLSNEYLEKLGFYWHTDADETPYVSDEIVRVSAAEADAYYEAANELYEMFVAAAQHVIDNNLFHELGIPFNMTILYSGLQDIPDELYEAASLDGAVGWKAFRHVTWPLLRPVVSVVLVLGVVYTLKVLDIILGLTGGGPSNATQTLATQSYKLSFANFEFGQGAALGNILVLVSVVFAVVYLRLSRSGEGS